MDRLEVHLARVEEVRVLELGEALERRRERDADRVLDEARLQVRVLDDEQLVGALQQLVDRRAHRRLDDVDEPLGVQLVTGADVERAAAALVVRRQRHELEDPVDVVLFEARLEKPLRRLVADEALRARAGVDPGRLDADEAPDVALRRGCRDADQRDHLLRRELRHGRLPLQRILRADPHLRPKRALPLDDLLGNVLRERLDDERLADHDALDRLLEQLREAGHVDALLRRDEVDGAVDLRRDDLLEPSPAEVDRLLDALHAGARQPEPDVRLRGLEVACDKLPVAVHDRFAGYVVRPSHLSRGARPPHAARDDLRVRADDAARGRARAAGLALRRDDHRRVRADDGAARGARPRRAHRRRALRARARGRRHARARACRRPRGGRNGNDGDDGSADGAAVARGARRLRAQARERPLGRAPRRREDAHASTRSTRPRRR